MFSMKQIDYKKRWNVADINLSFAGCGFLGIYYSGVVACFLKYAPHLLRNRIAGTSAGAFVGSWILCDVPIERVVRYSLEVSRKARKRYFAAINPTFDVKKYLYDALNKFLPEDAHLKVNGKLHISVTRVCDGKNTIISNFDSREDLIEAVLASAFVPFVVGVIPPKYKGVRYIDGIFSVNQPVLDENTITVSPFIGEWDIYPRDDSLLPFSSIISKIESFVRNMYRLYRVFSSPCIEELLMLSKQGYDDTVKFLIKNDLISCAKCLAVQYTSAVSEAINENNECNPECQECVKFRQEAFVSKLPEDIVTLFQEFAKLE